jgi:ABC-type transport system involved in multi-copper enzyme maturation permease subunit
MNVMQLLKLEYIKYQPTAIFRISILAYLALLPFIAWGYHSMIANNAIEGVLDLNSQFKFPKVFDTFAYLSSWLSFFFLPFLSILIVSNEYSDRTLRQSIINGLTREQFLISKIAVLVVLSAICALYSTLLGFIWGFANGGHVSEIGAGPVVVFYVFLQNLGYCSMGFLLAVMVRRSGIAIFILMPYIFFIERLIRYLVLNQLGLNKASDYLPANIFNTLINSPMDKLQSMANITSLPVSVAVVVSVFYIALFLGGALLHFKKKDI